MPICRYLSTNLCCEILFGRKEHCNKLCLYFGFFLQWGHIDPMVLYQSRVNIIHILGYVHANKLGNIFMTHFRCHHIQARSSVFHFISSPNPNPKHNSATTRSLNALHRLPPHSTPRRGGLQPQPEFPVVSR